VLAAQCTLRRCPDLTTALIHAKTVICAAELMEVIMAEYYRASELEPSVDDLSALLESSSPSDWLFDDETNSFTSRKNLLVVLAPNNQESYTLRYGHMDVFNVSNRFMNERVFATPEWPAQTRAQVPRPAL
jgi:hypothetical protein